MIFTVSMFIEIIWIFYYRNWHFGKVITQTNQLDNALQNYKLWQKEFLKIQKEAIEYTFNITEESSSKRVAKAIKALVSNSEKN